MFDASGVFVELTECRRRYLKTNRKCRMIWSVSHNKLRMLLLLCVLYHWGKKNLSTLTHSAGGEGRSRIILCCRTSAVLCLDHSIMTLGCMKCERRTRRIIYSHRKQANWLTLEINCTIKKTQAFNKNFTRIKKGKLLAHYATPASRMHHCPAGCIL